MEKWFCWGAMGISGILFILFILDMVTKSIPFGGLSLIVDIMGAAACAIVGCLAWDSLKDLR